MNLYVRHLGYVRWGVELILIEVERNTHYFYLTSDSDIHKIIK